METKREQKAERITQQPYKKKHSAMRIAPILIALIIIDRK